MGFRLPMGSVRRGSWRDRNGEGKSLIGLGIAYQSLGEYRRAIEYQEQSLAIQREIGDLWGQAASFNGLGLAWAKLNRQWKAKENCIAARDIFAELSLEHMVKKVENNLQLQALPWWRRLLRTLKRVIHTLFTP